MFIKVLIFFMTCQLIYADFIRDDIKNIIVDNERNLIWQDNEVSPKMNWKKSDNYCAGLTLNNKNDWRVPKLKELETITKVNFHNLVKEGYWSSETFEGYAGFAWIIHFHSGNSYKYAKSAPIYTRCIRDNK